MSLQIIILLAFTAASFAFKSGAPLGACEHMMPHHQMSEVQSSPAPYAAKVDVAEAKNGDKVKISINGGTFKGFFVQVRDEIDVAVGNFEIEEGIEAQLLDCFGNKASAATHVNRNEKTSITLSWKPPEEPGVYTIHFARTSRSVKLISNTSFCADLLNPRGNEESDEEDERIRAGNTYVTPADINNDVKETAKEEDKEEIKEAAKNEFEDEFETHYQTQNDWKQTPKWDVSYRQKVTASDVFLQMGGKNPSTASCENMIIKVDLPEESRQNIDLKVLKDTLEVNSQRFYLKIPLPHPVNPQLGNAQYDADTQQLVISLVMQREFDYVNF